MWFVILGWKNSGFVVSFSCQIVGFGWPNREVYPINLFLSYCQIHANIKLFLTVALVLNLSGWRLWHGLAPGVWFRTMSSGHRYGHLPRWSQNPCKEKEVREFVDDCLKWRSERYG